MKQKLLRPSVVWLSTIFFLVLQISCVNKGRVPPPENVREKFGKMGVASAHFEPEYLLPKRVSETSGEALQTVSPGRGLDHGGSVVWL